MKTLRTDTSPTFAHRVVIGFTFGFALALFTSGALADDWPQWRGPKRDGVYRETGVVDKLPSTPRYKWRVPIGAGYAGPAVAAGRVYVTDRQLREGERNPDNPFSKSPVRGSERVLCLDAKSGEILWKHEYPCRYTLSYPSGPRATPTVHEGKVYALGAMGNLLCLAADSPKVLWSKNYVEDYGTKMNTWGMTAAPLVDGEKLILLVGGKDGAGVVAVHKDTGEEIWRSLELPDPGYCPPQIIESGGKRQLIVWTPDFVAGLGPGGGEVYWKQGFDIQSNLTIATPSFDAKNNRLFITSFYNGPRMFQLDGEKPGASLLWKGKSDSETQPDILHGLMCSPVQRDGYIYGICGYGQLRCIKAETGEQMWETRDATGKGRWWNAFIIPHGDRYFISNEQGELITAKLSPKGYEETSRVKIIEPTNRVRRRMIVWSHPAFANRSVYMRNDKEIVCVDIAAK